MPEYIFEMSYALYDETTGQMCTKPEYKGKLTRCKDCKWFGKAGCAVSIVDESDEPKENDYCSWAERKEE